MDPEIVKMLPVWLVAALFALKTLLPPTVKLISGWRGEPPKLMTSEEASNRIRSIEMRLTVLEASRRDEALVEHIVERLRKKS